MSSARVVKSLPKILRKSVILGCVGYTFQQYVASPWLLAEDSMDPTFKDGQLVLSTAWYNSLSRGDVVIVKQLQNPKERVCKRIVALPGDTVRYKKQDVIVPSGQMWLEGDNKVASWDSRDYGPVPIGLIEGLVFHSLKPWAHKDSWKHQRDS